MRGDKQRGPSKFVPMPTPIDTFDRGARVYRW
jgi:hypothetical protein